jgi:ferritin-like metal-binding protein YciE
MRLLRHPEVELSAYQHLSDTKQHSKQLEQVRSSISILEVPVLFDCLSGLFDT